MAGGIFISYRRSDSAAFSGRLADYFSYNFPDIRVFFDIVSIEPGAQFVDAITERLTSSEVVVVMIGKGWLNAGAESGQRRLDNPDDFVRLELSTALSLGIRVIPVLLDDAQMPGPDELPEPLRGLSSCNAQFIRGVAFQRDAEFLGNYVNDFIKASQKVVTAPPQEATKAVSSDVKTALVSAFEDYKAADPSSFMICENGEGQFVQFVRSDNETVTLDLPTTPLTPDQIVAAQRMLLEDYQAETYDFGDGDFAFNLDLPFEPQYLSHMVLDIFEHVYGKLPAAPLGITIDM